MGHALLSLVKKDLLLMATSKFFVLALGSLILYSCYIHLVYVRLDQEIYPVYLYDPHSLQTVAAQKTVKADTLKQLQEACSDGYAVGIDASGQVPRIYMVSSGLESTDNSRAAYAVSLLSSIDRTKAEIIGAHNKEMKSRREITCEFLFFELSAVGFLGLASTLYKEKQMGVIRVHSTLPVSRAAFILTKLTLFVLADLIFSILLTLINLGLLEGFSVLPAVMVQAGILSAIMALTGFFFAICLQGFRQFSLLYLVFAVFITTPVFLAGQTGISWDWIVYHPMYHLFIAMKNAYFGVKPAEILYYTACTSAIILLFTAVCQALVREMAKEG